MSHANNMTNIFKDMPHISVLDSSDKSK